MRNMRCSFALVEVMIVVAVLGLLMTIAIPSFVKSRVKAKEAMCKSNARILMHAFMNADTASNWTIPDGPVDCNTWKIKETDGWAKGNPKCPFGTHNYTFFKDGETYKIRCPNRYEHTSEWLAEHPEGFYES